ncbi:hypothetical protein Dimus_015859, partial [Dionaea muscipula]
MSRLSLSGKEYLNCTQSNQLARVCFAQTNHASCQGFNVGCDPISLAVVVFLLPFWAIGVVGLKIDC